MSLLDKILGKKKKWGIPEDWAPVSMGDNSAIAVAQYVMTYSSSPYVPSVQSPIHPFLDARKKNDLSKLKVRIAIPSISSVMNNFP